MMHRAWSSTVEVPYCFSRSYVKFQGHPALKIVEFDSNWAFPDCSSSLNLPMAMKCCTKLETAKEICSIVFLGHPSNFKVTRYKTSRILTHIGRFRTIGRSQLSNPSDLPCWRSSVKFQGHTALKIIKFDPDWAFPDCNSSLNTNGYEVLHKAWSSIKEVPYCFSRSSIKLQGRTALKIVEFNPDWRFRTVTPILIHQWVRNDAQSLK